MNRRKNPCYCTCTSDRHKIEVSIGANAFGAGLSIAHQLLLLRPPLLQNVSPPSTGAYKHAGRRDSYRPYIDNDDLGDPTADFAGVVCVAAGEQDGQRHSGTIAAATRRGLPTPGACRWGERANTGCYSRGGAELWRTDGTAKGTRRVDDLRAGVSGSFPSYLTEFDGALFYAAHTDLTGTELFRSDGTSGGANIVEVQHDGLTRNEAYFRFLN